MRKDRRLLGIILAIIILGAGGAYYYGNGSQSQAQQSQEATMAIAQATRGNLTITADGSAPWRRERKWLSASPTGAGSARWWSRSATM